MIEGKQEVSKDLEKYCRHWNRRIPKIYKNLRKRSGHENEAKKVSVKKILAKLLLILLLFSSGVRRNGGGLRMRRRLAIFHTIRQKKYRAMTTIIIKKNYGGFREELILSGLTVEEVTNTGIL